MSENNKIFHLACAALEAIFDRSPGAVTHWHQRGLIERELDAVSGVYVYRLTEESFNKIVALMSRGSDRVIPRKKEESLARLRQWIGDPNFSFSPSHRAGSLFGDHASQGQTPVDLSRRIRSRMVYLTEDGREFSNVNEAIEHDTVLQYGPMIEEKARELDGLPKPARRMLFEHLKKNL